MTIQRLLIANRGEIACRVIRTARRLGIRSIAVYSEADEHALHVRMADAAYPIGPAPAEQSYLDAGAILEAAERSGAEAIHPGYGFLSENADFALACGERGIAFVGPPVDAIRSMAEKDVAKALMREAGVPVIPGDEGPDDGGGQGAQEWLGRASELGFPLLIKAVAGGGGRGMRVVERAGDFSAALESAQREARSAFGEDRILIERLLSPSRHVEVQVFGDSHGNVVHLFERDCSIQRRHQKVIEEAPAPGLPAEMRAQMGAAAVQAAKAIGYRGAGTVEFLVDVSARGDSKPFYFMEMNTRLQVEHPVSEMITGQDLVEWQLRVADGEALPLTQAELEVRGHSIEARIYAEDVRAGFLPSSGRIRHLAQPAESAELRIETGFEAGDAVCVHYDAMLAKLVVWGHDREHAVGRLKSALLGYELAGLPTNRDLLARIADHPEFQGGEVDSLFLDRVLPELLERPPGRLPEIVAVAVMDSLLARTARARAGSPHAVDSHSPWSLADGWRLNGPAHESMAFALDGDEHHVEIEEQTPGCFALRIADTEVAASGQTLEWMRGAEPSVGIHRFECTLDGERHIALVVSQGESVEVFFAGETHALVHRDLQAESSDEEEVAGAVRTPMPGRICRVLVSEGDDVEKGQPLVVLEAMKMEHTICAGLDAAVEVLSVSEGDQVDGDATLLVLAAR